MPTGVWKVISIPTQGDAEQIKRDYEDDVPTPSTKVVKEQDGTWTVIATYPGEGNMTKKFGT